MASNSNGNMEALLNEVSLLRKEIAALMASQAPMGSAAKKAPKVKDPEAPKKAPNSWILFTGRVRAVLKENALAAGKEAQQYASYLKTTYPEAYEMDPETILSHHDEWTPPPPKPKEEKAEEKPKAKRVLTEEHKAKMAAGRRAAAERRKAEAAAKEAEEAAAALGAEEDEVEEELEEVVEVVVKAPPKPPKDLTPLPFKGKKLLWDKETGGCWEKGEDGKKGKWMGVLEGTGKDRKLNGGVPEPEED